MAMTVSKSGEIWNGASWIPDSVGTRIGLLKYEGGVRFRCMTTFTLSLDKAYTALTLSFSMSKSGTTAYYATSKPSEGGSTGTAMTLSASGNSVTLRGSYQAGQTVKIYVWGRNSSTFDYATVTSCSATGVEPTPVDDGGVAKVRVSGAWADYAPYIRVSGAWVQYEPYVYMSGQWRKMG